jgi:hypothetical protein
MRAITPQPSPAVFVAAVVAILFSSNLRAQSSGRRVDTLRLSPPDSVLVLSSRFLQRSSVVVDVEGVGILRDGIDMSVDAVQGRIILLPSLRVRLEGRSDIQAVVQFRSLPFSLRERYATPSAERITSAGRPVVIPARRPDVNDSEWFGRGLQRSGTIVRGLSVGTNRDASLTSGLRLQLSGSLAQDVNVVAALSDENSPLQPEGTTQTLREVDRVFIDITGRTYGITLGDLVYARPAQSSGSFGAVSRKFQGAHALLREQTLGMEKIRATVGVVVASARGKFHTVRFQGSEGNQGPYRLTGKNGEPRVVVIAGSERVSINGESMVRGEIQDYVIDYASGEVVFTSKRPITSASRIVIDFEYADRQYARNAVGASFDAVWRDSSVVVNAAILQEADDPDAPMDLGLTDEMRDILRTSGADRFKASLSSVRDLGIDSTSGRAAGQYIRVDTTLHGRPITIYRYAPGDPAAFYAVTFSPVERMPSDSAGYVRISSGEYRFAGIGVGTYLPVQFIPLPQLQRTAHATVRIRPVSGVTLLADVAGSVFDRNRLSSLDDAGTGGDAQAFGLDANSGRIRWGGIDLGHATLSLSRRVVAASFVSPDRIDPAEYERQWDLSGPRTVDELRHEARIAYDPRSWVRAEGFTGTVERAGEARSSRSGAKLTLDDLSGAAVTGETERVARDLSALNTRSVWLRHGVVGSMAVDDWRPGLRMTVEDRMDRFAPSDSVLDGSFRIMEWAPHLSWQPARSFAGRVEFQVRSEDSAFAGVRRHASDVLTQSYSAEVRPWETVRSDLSLHIRRTNFTDEFRRRGNGDATTLLMRSHTRASTSDRGLDGDLLYEFSNQRSARLERVFIPVARGSGNYRYVGDSNGNGIADEAEYALVRFDGDFVAFLIPGEALVPVNDVKASVRVRWNATRSIGRHAPAWLRALSTETLLRVEERSSDPHPSNVYALRWGTFLASATTLAGQQLVTQDVHVFEGDPAFSVRARIVERRALTQLVSAPERAYGNERSLRIRNRWSVDLGQQTDLWVRRDRMLSNGANPRERDITAVGGAVDMTMRLDRQWEAGWSIGLASNADRRSGTVVEATTNEQALRLTFGMPMAGQIRGEVRREESTIASSTGLLPAHLPYELTDGKAVGRSWLWRLSGDLQVTSLIQVSVGYFGRQEGGGPTVHTARVEARAVF